MKTLSKIFIIGFVATSCAKTGTTVTGSKSSLNSSVAAAPNPPLNKLLGRGFGLAGADATSDSSTPSTPSVKAPEGSIAVPESGGSWRPTDSTSSSGYGYQYYDKSGTASNWYGKPTTDGNTKKFSMIEGTNTGQVFNREKGSDGNWKSEGTITDSQGKPYVFTDPLNSVDKSHSIVSNGYTQKPDGTADFNWEAKTAGTTPQSKTFQTNGYNLNQASLSGLVYISQPPAGQESVQQKYSPSRPYNPDGMPTSGEYESAFMNMFQSIMTYQGNKRPE